MSIHFQIYIVCNNIISKLFTKLLKLVLYYDLKKNSFLLLTAVVVYLLMKPLIKGVMNYYSFLSFAFRKTDKVNIYVYPKNGAEK